MYASESELLGRKRIAVGVPLLVLGLSFLMTIPGASACIVGCSGEGAYSGRAFGAWVSVPGVINQYFADTGDLPPEGGAIYATPETVNTPAAQAEVLVSWTMGVNSVAQSEAATGDVVLLAGTELEVRADFVRAWTVATCDGVSGGSEITGLTVGGQAVVVTGDTNQYVINTATVVLLLNEQGTNTADGCNAITVNAIHLWVAGGTEVIVSSAHSDITCPVGPSGGGGEETPHDFVTGGGWITPYGAKANFGFVAGYKPHKTEVSGNLNYIDHNDGMHVKSEEIQTYEITGEHRRTFTGTASVDGVSGYTFSCTVEDNAEPGHGVDWYELHVFENGYDASGYLGGGNIQLHPW